MVVVNNSCHYIAFVNFYQLIKDLLSSPSRISFFFFFVTFFFLLQGWRVLWSSPSTCLKRRAAGCPERPPNGVLPAPNWLLQTHFWREGGLIRVLPTTPDILKASGATWPWYQLVWPWTQPSGSGSTGAAASTVIATQKSVNCGFYCEAKEIYEPRRPVIDEAIPSFPDFANFYEMCLEFTKARR